MYAIKYPTVEKSCLFPLHLYKKISFNDIASEYTHKQYLYNISHSRA